MLFLWVKEDVGVLGFCLRFAFAPVSRPSMVIPLTDDCGRERETASGLPLSHTLVRFANQKYSNPMWKVILPSGSLRMLVMYTGAPPPSCERLEGVVNGVNAVFAALG